MSALTLERAQLSHLIGRLSDQNVSVVLDYVSRLSDEEPPLNEDELEGLHLAEQDIAGGKTRPFAGSLI